MQLKTLVVTGIGIRLLLAGGLCLATFGRAAAEETASGNSQTQQDPSQSQSKGQGQAPSKPEPKPDPSQGSQKPEEPKPKTSIERETGTVNDRIFEVMPNYGTVRTSKDLPPMTTGQKFRMATASVTDYFAFPFNAALAGIDQANNSPKSWGQGWGAYGKRFGSTFADNSIGTYMTVAVFPSILKEDPRYYRMAEGKTSKRIWYPLGRLFVTRMDDGSTGFNTSELVGNSVATGLSNFYHAREDRTVGRNFGTLGMLFMWDGLSNELKEFWPDIRRKFKHKKPAAGH
jgi:hypothetical protein